MRGGRRFCCSSSSGWRHSSTSLSSSRSSPPDTSPSPCFQSLLETKVGDSRSRTILPRITITCGYDKERRDMEVKRLIHTDQVLLVDAGGAIDIETLQTRINEFLFTVERSKRQLYRVLVNDGGEIVIECSHPEDDAQLVNRLHRQGEDYIASQVEKYLALKMQFPNL